MLRAASIGCAKYSGSSAPKKPDHRSRERDRFSLTGGVRASCIASGGGRNRTHRTGSARPTRFEDEEGHQTPFTSGPDSSQTGGAVMRRSSFVVSLLCSLCLLFV